MIEPARKDIDTILSDNQVRYSVPKNQRSFDWGKSELQELMDDLIQVVDSGKNHLFLGNFIFDVSDREDYKIVDGQQRLTTVSLIIIAIREHAKSINEAEYAGDMQKYISFKSAWSKEKGNRLQVSPSILDVFDYMSDIRWDGKFPDKIDGKAVKRQANKIKPVYQFIQGEIKDYNIDRLMQLTEALMTAYVVVIKIDNPEDVFSIFERTNARGLDLNIADLLKNYIFSYGAEEYEEKWYEIISNADNSVPRMLKYFWVSRKGYIKQSDLYRAVRDYGNEIGIDVFVEELFSFSRFYSIARSMKEDEVMAWLEEQGMDELAKNEDCYPKINRVFQALKLFSVTQAYPIIFSIFEMYKKSSGNNKDKLLTTLEAIEKYHFINSAIAGRVGNEVEKFYAEKAKYFYENEGNFKDEMNGLLKELRNKKAKDSEFISGFVENVIYDQRNIGLINYIFDRINNLGVKGGQWVSIYAPDKHIDKRNFNIEHILPQSYRHQFEENEKEQLDKIGNLIVVSRHSNSEFQDKTPLEKSEIIKKDKKHYGNLRYIDDFIEEYSAEFKDWNLNTIDARSKKLAELGYTKVWSF